MNQRTKRLLALLILAALVRPVAGTPWPGLNAPAAIPHLR